MKAFVTGGRGFVGSHLIPKLVSDGWNVVCWDKADRVEHDILSTGNMVEAMHGCDVVFHLAANADVRYGPKHPELDLQQNTIGTFSVLEAMINSGVSRIAFTSTASVYGETTVYPTPESAPFPVQTSFYGASKLAGEALIQAFCASFGFEAYIFRLVGVLGEGYHHGHVLDFAQQLMTHPDHIDIQGDGHARKAYVYVKDVVSALLAAVRLNKPGIYNVALPQYISVNESVDRIVSYFGLKPTRTYTGGERGWVGDNPFIFLDIAKISDLGWSPQIGIYEALERTLNDLKERKWLLD